MNAFNRIVMLIIALLLIAVPVLLLLVTFGVVSEDLIDAYTGYRSAVESLGNLSLSDITGTVRVVIAIVGLLVALIALLLLLRELTFGRRVARSTVMEDAPGKETVITAGAVKALAEGAAREVGAESPSVSLTSKDRRYLVSVGKRVPPSGNYTELATRTRENVRKVLGEQGVPVEDVEVTVQGTASQRKEG
jgi:amino acid permease